MCLPQASRMIPCPSFFYTIGFQKILFTVFISFVIFKVWWYPCSAFSFPDWVVPWHSKKVLAWKSGDLSSSFSFATSQLWASLISFLKPYSSEEDRENGLSVKASCLVVAEWIIVVESHVCHFLVGCPWANYLTTASPSFFTCNVRVVIWPHFVACLWTSHEIVQITTPLVKSLAHPKCANPLPGFILFSSHLPCVCLSRQQASRTLCPLYSRCTKSLVFFEKRIIISIFFFGSWECSAFCLPLLAKAVHSFLLGQKQKSPSVDWIGTWQWDCSVKNSIIIRIWKSVSGRFFIVGFIVLFVAFYYSQLPNNSFVSRFLCNLHCSVIILRGRN